MILDAVCAHPPYAFPPTNMWHVMHGDMKGLHEARDEHDGALYRLFCVLDREAPAFGIARPSIILISGGVKPTGRDMAPKIYAAARSYRDDYLRTRRVVP